MIFLKWCFTLGFAFMALYHLFQAFIPQAGDAAMGERHLLYFLVNIFATILVAWNRPRALLFLIPLVFAQIYNYGLASWPLWVLLSLLSYYIYRRFKFG